MPTSRGAGGGGGGGEGGGGRGGGGGGERGGGGVGGQSGCESMPSHEDNILHKVNICSGMYSGDTAACQSPCWPKKRIVLKWPDRGSNSRPAVVLTHALPGF